MKRIRLGISSCLLGERVRYDGGDKLDRYITGTLGRHAEWMAVCPEVGCGLSVPREAMKLVAAADGTRLVTSSSGVDHTDRMRRWVNRRLDELEREDLCGFIFKSGSPSCGLRDVTIYDASGDPAAAGAGIFAAEFVKRFPLIPVEDDLGLQDPALMENFIERVYAFRRLKELRGD